MKELSHILIRKATNDDIDAVIDIENQEFLHPWKRSMFESEIDHDIAFFYVAVAQSNQQVVGYIIFWVIGNQIELHNIAVCQSHKKKGIGKKLLSFLLDQASQYHVAEIFLEVRASNHEAISFYEAHQFKRVIVRKKYYNNPVESAIVYKRQLI